MFPPGAHFRPNRNCPRCGLPIERDEGSFLGAMALNYGVTIIIFLVPVLLLYLGGYLSGLAAALLAGVGAVVVPALLYRPSRSWWLMNYYVFLPHHLPANQRELEGSEDANT